MDIYDPRDVSSERNDDGIRDRDDRRLTLGRGPENEHDESAWEPDRSREEEAQEPRDRDVAARTDRDRPIRATSLRATWICPMARSASWCPIETAFTPSMDQKPGPWRPSARSVSSQNATSFRPAMRLPTPEARTWVICIAKASSTAWP